MSRITKNRLKNRRSGNIIPTGQLAKNQSMNTNDQFEIKEFLRIDACFKLGIMPPPPFDLNQASEKQKRKFRKLWRNLIKKDPKKLSGTTPTSVHPHMRRALVMQWIEKTYVEPAVKLFMNSMNNNLEIEPSKFENRINFK